MGRHFLFLFYLLVFTPAARPHLLIDETGEHREPAVVLRKTGEFSDWLLHESQARLIVEVFTLKNAHKVGCMAEN